MAKKQRTSIEKRIGTTAGARQLNIPITSEFENSVTPGAVVEGSRLLSLANRNLYRQHKVYRMKVNLLNGAETRGPIAVWALRNTWHVRKALALAKRMHDMAVKEEKAVVGNARWNDFRIKCSWATQSLNLPSPTAWPSVLTFDGAANFKLVHDYLGYGSTGEYNYSSVDAGGLIKRFDLVVPSGGDAYNVFREFNKMGPQTVEEPGTPSPGGYDFITQTFDATMVEELLDKGDLPPYQADLSTDSTQTDAWVCVGYLQVDGTTGAQATTTGFFEAPLGIVLLDGYTLPLATGAPNVEVEFAPGDYKGVMALDI